MTPLFSCVVPVKGRRPFLDEAMASLEGQGLGSDLEVIVRDGDVEPDAGQADALNRGFARARGEWLFWLNADDLLLSGALSAVLRKVSAEGSAAGAAVDWVSGNLVYMDEGGRILKCAWDCGSRRAFEGFPVRVYGPSSFFRRELFERSGGFDASLRFSMDTELWCRFRAGARLEGGSDAGTAGRHLVAGAFPSAWFVKIPCYIWAFRVHGGSLTSSDLLGRTPAAMAAEAAAIDRAYGLGRRGWPLWRLRLARLVNGGYARSLRDTLRLRGRHISVLTT